MRSFLPASQLKERISGILFYPFPMSEDRYRKERERENRPDRPERGKSDKESRFDRPERGRTDRHDRDRRKSDEDRSNRHDRDRRVSDKERPKDRDRGQETKEKAVDDHGKGRKRSQEERETSSTIISNQDEPQLKKVKTENTQATSNTVVPLSASVTSSTPPITSAQTGPSPADKVKAYSEMLAKQVQNFN